jgi:predicted Zn finger-like uncharacterized protein
MSAEPATMGEEKFTRCPGCKTIFRVTAPQLEMRGGQVRCGHCRTAFDGVAALVSLEPRIVERSKPSFEEMDLGPPTMTLRSSRALEPVVAVESETPVAADEPLAPARPADAADSGPGPGEIAYASRFSEGESRHRARAPAWLLGLAIPVLLLLLAAQAAFHYRDVVAGRWPALKPALVRACTALGCTIRPLQDNNGLSIEASDLQSDPAHRGLLILTATLRNRTAAALAYPHLELTLTDTREQVVVRRAFSPQEYAGGTADLSTGIAGNAEVGVKLFIDASATSQAGYQVYLFYP